MCGLAADDPAHRRIMAQPLGVVDVLVSSLSPEHSLPQQSDERTPAVLAGAGVGEPLAGQVQKAERVVEFAEGKQPRVGGHDRTAKLQGQPPVEIEPLRLALRFTSRVRRRSSIQISLTC